MTEKKFVHRYKWSHAALRAKIKRWLKKGKVKLILKNKDGALYDRKAGKNE